jgi:hypothetical protein
LVHWYQILSEEAKLFGTKPVKLGARNIRIGDVIRHLKNVGLQTVQIQVVAKNVSKFPFLKNCQRWRAKFNIFVHIGVSVKVPKGKVELLKYF